MFYFQEVVGGVFPFPLLSLRLPLCLRTSSSTHTDCRLYGAEISQTLLPPQYWLFLECPLTASGNENGVFVENATQLRPGAGKDPRPLGPTKGICLGAREQEQNLDLEAGWLAGFFPPSVTALREHIL